MRVNRAASLLLLVASAPAFAGPNPTTMTRYTLRTDPAEWEVRCNDGSVPVFYFLPGTGEGADKWVIHLQGGSSCQNPAECERRAFSDKPELMGTGCLMDNAGVVTCGQTEGVFSRFFGNPSFPTEYDDELGPTKDYDGVHSSSTDNPYRTWNRVEVRYCSSDTWAGQGALGPVDDAPGQALYSQLSIVNAGGAPVWTMGPALHPDWEDWTGTYNTSGGPVPTLDGWENVWIQDNLVAGAWSPAAPATYAAIDFTEETLFFNGRNIVQRLIEQLLDGDLDADGLADPGVDLLSLADEVVFMGSSAGGVGARTNLDAVGDQIRAVNPDVAYWGVIEGSFSGGEDPATTPSSAPALSTSVTGNGGAAWERLLAWNSFVDTTCEAGLGVPLLDVVTAYDLRGECYNTTSVIEGDWLDTRFAVRHALWDSITRPPYVANGTGTARQERRAQQQFIEYGGWHLNESSQEEAFFFPCTAQHVVLTDNSFYDQGVESGGVGDSFADVLTRWMANAGNTRLAATGCTP